MSKYSIHQHKETGEDWYKWFNNKYKRHQKIKTRKSVRTH